jgi:nucleoside-diphosphate-sugar epimerase
MFYKLYGLPVVMVRPFMTYGPGQDEHKLIPYVILSLLKGEAPRLSSGEQQFDWIYVDDVTDGFVAAAQADNTESHTVDLGSGRLVSVRTDGFDEALEHSPGRSAWERSLSIAAA